MGLRLVFLGTPQFAVPTLDAIAAAGYDVTLVVTQPDRPKGRGQSLAASPVKEAALRLGIPTFQPERVRRPEGVARLAEEHADAMVIVGYGQIIPQSIIDLAPLGIINVHASLLPKYRGAGPIQWALVNGETVTGVTTMRIDAGLDTGDMLLKSETPVDPDETAIELGKRLATMGAKLLVETLEGLRQGTITPEKQNSDLATHAPLLKKEDGLIDWTQPADAIHNRVRGLQPWPGAYTTFRGSTLHIWRSRLAAVTSSTTEPGRISRLGQTVLVACGDHTALELVEVQQEGRKRMSATDFANGQRLAENELLGESIR